MNYSEDFQKMIKRYNEELKNYNKKAKSKITPVNAESITQNSTIQNDISNETKESNNNLFQENYILPNIEENQIIEGQKSDLTGEGYLKVQVFTAKQASPLSGAVVSISLDNNGEALIKNYITDINGETPLISLPTVSKEESLNPGIANPYASYRVRISADGFFTIDSVNVPIFDGESSVLPVEMLPLPEGYNGKIILKSLDTGAIGLN